MGMMSNSKRLFGRIVARFCFNFYILLYRWTKLIQFDTTLKCVALAVQADLHRFLKIALRHLDFIHATSKAEITDTIPQSIELYSKKKELKITRITLDRLSLSLPSGANPFLLL